jgi:hypothetical protein
VTNPTWITGSTTPEQSGDTPGSQLVPHRLTGRTT